jgi:hypothetical protein
LLGEKPTKFSRIFERIRLEYGDLVAYGETSNVFHQCRLFEASIKTIQASLNNIDGMCLLLRCVREESGALLSVPAVQDTRFQVGSGFALNHEPIRFYMRFFRFTAYPNISHGQMGGYEGLGEQRSEAVFAVI